MGGFTLIDHWQDVTTYAKNSGVVKRTIVRRINRGVLCHTVIDGKRIIDAQATPPVNILYASKEKVPPFQWPANLPPRAELVWLSRFAEKHRVRADRFYRAILFGELPGWGVSGSVLVRRKDLSRIMGE